MRQLRHITRMPMWIWYSWHELTHILIGLAFAWGLREIWGTFSVRQVIWAVVGSVILDADHLLYFFLYGRHEWYAQETRKILRQGQIGTLIKFWKDNHKHQTGLASHNIYFLSFFLCVCVAAFYFDWQATLVFFGCMVLHLLYDIFDDLWMLGRINENWKRLKRKKAMIGR